MICQKGILLKNKTSFHVGGVVNNFHIPENEQELMQLVSALKAAGKEIRILSGGSNLLVNDKRQFDDVISMEKACLEMTYEGDGCFKIGASCRIQKVIRFVNDMGYGGFEELIGLPALFGGIIFMNAGIGGRSNAIFNICDFIYEVRTLEVATGKIRIWKKEECAFDYRKSAFQQGGYVILGATVKLGKQDKEVSEERIQKRRQYIKSNQEWGKGCFGTCFSRCSRRLLRIVARLPITRKIKQGKKNENWLVNTGDGSYSEAMRIINTCKGLHRILGKPIDCEVVIWE